MKKLVYAGLIVLGTLSLPSCGGETKTENAIENAGDAAGDAADAAGDAVESTLDSTGAALDSAATGTMDSTRQ